MKNIFLLTLNMVTFGL